MYWNKNIDKNLRGVLMINLLGLDTNISSFIGVLFAFIATFAATALLKGKLPTDQGRAFAHDGAKSAGKPRGAGIIFILAFVISALLFADFSVELLIYLALVTIEMLTGYFDDAAEKPWGELLKGVLDLVVAIATAVAFLYYNGNVVSLAIFGISFEIPVVLYGILIVVLVWASINVTNCSDGVDGLSASLVITTLGSFFVLNKIMVAGEDINYVIVLFVICLLAYLWFNATPSILLMGDAGSRAMGIFIAIVALKSQSPFMYILLAIVLILDGGLGLVKVSLIRVCKIHILKNTTTPLHDHARKKKEWSNTHVVFRFVILQFIVSAAALYLVMM